MQTHRAHEPLAVPSGKRSTASEDAESRAVLALDPADDSLPTRPIADLIVFVGIALLLLLDLVADAARTSLWHVGIEIAATVFALIAAGRLIVRWTAARRVLQARVTELRGRLHEATAEAAKWRAEARDALEGLGAAIDRQCDRWGLTEAERGVAVLLLKGLSMKEIADVRGTAERTARQQANAVYRKAGLAGRAELAAFFLEDLLLPSTKGS